MVMRCFPFFANSGMNVATGSSMWMSSRSCSMCTSTAVMALLPEKKFHSVSGVACTFTPLCGSSGPLPRACPMVRCSTTWPRRRTQMAMPGWMAVL